MIVVDTSALYAIIAREPDADVFADAIFAADRAIVGAPTAFELRLVFHRRSETACISAADTLLNTSPLEVVPWTPNLVRHATDALHRFGGRPARLNYGDCMAYALAKSLDAPLLFKGGDFAATDVRAALPQ